MRLNSGFILGHEQDIYFWNLLFALFALIVQIFFLIHSWIYSVALRKQGILLFSSELNLTWKAASLCHFSRTRSVPCLSLYSGIHGNVQAPLLGGWVLQWISCSTVDHVQSPGGRPQKWVYGLWAPCAGTRQTWFLAQLLSWLSSWVHSSPQACLLLRPEIIGQ